MLSHARPDCAPCRAVCCADWLEQLAGWQELTRRAAEKRAAAGEAAAGDVAGAGRVATEVRVEATEVEASSQQRTTEGGLTSPRAEDYVDRMPVFWSLDNPLVAVAVALAGFVLVSGLLRGGL